MRHTGNPPPDHPRSGWVGRRQTGTSANLAGPTQAISDATVQRWWRYRYCFLEAKRIALAERRGQNMVGSESTNDPVGTNTKAVMQDGADGRASR